MTTLDVLKAARERISDPARWCQETYRVLDAGGSAIRWCAMATISDTTENNHLLGVAWGALRRAMGGGCIAEYNDTHTHAEVLALFDRAIAAEEQP
jgi:hypothetical protein